MPEKDSIVDRPSNALCIRMMIVFSKEVEQKSNEKIFLIDLTAAIFQMKTLCNPLSLFLFEFILYNSRKKMDKALPMSFRQKLGRENRRKQSKEINKQNA